MPSRKGSPNKLSGLAKDNIAAVFNRLGGTANMAKWAEENQTDFYKIYARLLPVQVTGEGGAPIRFELVAPWLTAAVQQRNS